MYKQIYKYEASLNTTNLFVNDVWLPNIDNHNFKNHNNNYSSPNNNEILIERNKRRQWHINQALKRGLLKTLHINVSNAIIIAVYSHILDLMA